MCRQLGPAYACILSLFVAQAAYAQSGDAGADDAPRSEADREASSKIENIVVTATRQETNLQETPIAITAVTSEVLETRGLTNTADLGGIIPNAAFRKSSGAYGPGMSAFIRGIGQYDTSLAGEQSISFYIDDVYYPLVFGSMFDLLDLDHVEVLRGPQGTLFGRNALAGAINLVSRQPELMTSSSYAQMTIGAYERRDFRAGFNTPIGDTAALQVSATSKERTGYQEILDFRCDMYHRGTPELAEAFPFTKALATVTPESPGNCVIGHRGGENVEAIRAALRWEPTEKLSLTATWDYLDDNSEAAADTILQIDRATGDARANLRTQLDQFQLPGGDFAYDDRFIPGSPFQTYATYADPFSAGEVVPGNTFYNGAFTRGGKSYEGFNYLRSWGGSLKAVYALTDAIDLVAIGGYRNVATQYFNDIDGSPLKLETNQNAVKQDDYTAELRLTGTSDAIDWVAGLFYYTASGLHQSVASSVWNNTQRFQNTRYEPDAKAVYLNTVIRPVDRVSITLGGRYSDDKKDVIFRNLLDGTQPGDTEFVPNLASSAVFDVTPADKRYDYKAGVDYQWTEDTMVYLSTATGFRLPGFNARPFQPSQITQYDGEEIQTYELGVKTDLFDNSLRLNATAFYTDYKTRIQAVAGQEYRLDDNGQPIPGDMVQVDAAAGQGVTACEPAPDGTPGFECIGRNFYINFPGEVKGFEAEFEAAPISGLLITGSVGYAKFSSADLDALPDTSNKRLRFIPDWTASGGIQYEFLASVLGGSITPRLDWFYQGAIVHSVRNKGYNQEGFSLFNSRITYKNDQHDFTVSVGATNLFDKTYYRNYFIFSDFGYPFDSAQPGAPREWYLTVGKKF